jgi:hypothetical protein
MRSKAIQISLLFFLVAIGFPTLSQKTIVKGVVLDKATQTTIPFATLFFLGTKTGVTSDLDGKFVFETYYSSDTLVCTMVGYLPLKKKIQQGKSQELVLELEANTQMKELVITDDKWEDPAIALIKKVLDNKKINNREKLDAYEYESYTKVEFDLNNIKESLADKKILQSFEFVFDQMDTTQEKNYLPIFMTESLSDVCFRREPKLLKEVIKGAKVSGVENESVNQFLGDMYQNINIYDNDLLAFNKSFTSPIAAYCLGFYDYKIQDTVIIDGKYCFEVKYEPKRRQELLFEGTMWIHDTTYAIKKLEAAITESANINWINHFSVTQYYDEVEKEVWMLVGDEMLVDFNFSDRKMGMYGRKKSSYNHFVINQPRDMSFFKGFTDVQLMEDASKHDEAYWDEHRHFELSKKEKQIYNMVDTLQSIPQFNTVVDIINLFINGYKVIGKYEIGPYYTLYSFNPIEGNRLRFGGRTGNAFSSRVMLDGFVAYGLLDQQWKYGGGALIVFNKNPRFAWDIHAKKDVEQIGQSTGQLRQDNILSSVFRRNPANKLTMVTEFSTFLEKEWVYGLSNKLYFKHRVLAPIGDFYRFRTQDSQHKTIPLSRIPTTELTISLRFAYKEKFIYGDFERISLGTSWPELEVSYTKSLPGVFGAQFNYQRAQVTLMDMWRLGPFGYMNFSTQAGKIYGQVPFPLLMMHQGNETFFYDDGSYNTMNYFEFVSDRWVSAWATYHAEGLLLNKIPIMRRLKWREVVSAKAVVGGYDQRNDNYLSRDWSVTPDGKNDVYTLTKPYFEAAVGVENIFKILRLDMLYRLSYLDHPDIFKVGLRAKIQFDF